MGESTGLHDYIRRAAPVALAAAAMLAITGTIERAMGRLPLGPDGRFGWWEGSVWSSEQSQRFADPYSFTHVSHGILVFGALWVIARRAPIRTRFLAAVAFECCWELLENSPWVLHRYREATIELGYMGDSILNSMSDVLMMSLGFFIASRLSWKVCALLLVASEVGLLLCVRDNLTLNIVMLVHRFDAVIAWQSAGRGG